MKTTALIFAFYLMSLSTAYACRCQPTGTPTEELADSDAVFSGRVIKIVNRKSGDPPISVEAVFTVVKAWKGVEKKQVSVYTASHSTMCGFKFSKGERYLIYANLNDKKELFTSFCTRTKSLDNAREDIEELDKNKPKTSLLPPKFYPPYAAAARAFISSGVTSSMCVANDQMWPNGSLNWPVLSP